MDDKNVEFTPEILAGYIPLLKQMRSTKRPLDSAPTFTPQNAFEQWQIYDDAGDKYLAIYIDGDWYSFTGTLIT